MADRLYTIVIDGKPAGPFSADELLTKNVQPESFIRKPSMDDYKEAHEFEELRELLGFQKQYTKPQYFASFDLRLLASCIDWFVIVFFTVFIDLIVVAALDSKEITYIILLSNIIILPMLKIIYHIVLEHKRQATFGKQLLNIKVTDINGLKPTLNQILIRNLSKLISTATLFLGYLYSFLNKKSQCLHDVIADTLVIKERLL